MPIIYKPKKNQKNSKGNAYDADRRRIYNSEKWRKLRAWKFAKDPLCEICKKEGIVTPAEDVHHIISFMSAKDQAMRKYLAYDSENLMSLCKKCHQRVHNKVK